MSQTDLTPIVTFQVFEARSYTSIINKPFTINNYLNQEAHDKLYQNCCESWHSLPQPYSTNDAEHELARHFRMKFSTICMMIVSFYEVGFSYDCKYLISADEECRTFLKDLVRHHLALKDLVRHHLALKDLVRRHLALKDLVRHHLALKDLVRHHLALKDLVRHHLALKDLVRRHLALKDLVRHHLALKDLVRHHLTLKDLVRHHLTSKSLGRVDSVFDFFTAV